MNRRAFLNTAAVGAAISLAAITAAPAATPKVKLGISSHSYWHFGNPKVPIEKVIENASALNVSGVDILHRQMDSEEIPYLQ